MGKVRVYEYAKKNNVSSKVVINKLKDMGIDVNNHMTALEDQAVEKLEKLFNPKPDKTSSAKPQNTNQSRTSQNQNQNQNRGNLTGQQKQQASNNQQRGGQQASRPSQSSARPKPGVTGTRDTQVNKQNTKNKPASKGNEGKKSVQDNQKRGNFKNNRNKKNNQRHQHKSTHVPTPRKERELPEKITFTESLSVQELSKKLHREPSEIIKNIITYFDFKTLTDDGTPSATERMENLAVLISIAGTYEELEEFLADATLMSSADEKSAKNSVTLMTMHAAKGLEFPVVFMVGMEEGLFPSARAEEKADLEEERRLAYVGMTRAMRKLFLTYTASRYSFGERNFNMPSRFLTELGYNPYGSAGYSKEIETGFSNDDFNDYDNFDNDPFPEDVPVYE